MNIKGLIDEILPKQVLNLVVIKHIKSKKDQMK